MSIRINDLTVRFKNGVVAVNKASNNPILSPLLVAIGRFSNNAPSKTTDANPITITFAGSILFK